MSKKEEKKPAEEVKAAPSVEAKGPPDEIVETRKKRKLVLLAGITAVVGTAAAAGGFFVYKTFLSQKLSLSAKSTTTPADGHGDKKDDEHGNKKDDGHGNKKDDGHGNKKDDGHGDKKDDGHGEKKDDGHGEKKDDGHGNKKEDTHGDKKDDGHGDKKENAAKDDKSDLKLFKSGETFGETFALPKMDLNLGNPLENRYLRIGISIEYSGGKNQQDDLKKREPQLKDIVISSVSTRTRLDLLTERGKEKLRRELINKINEISEQPVKTIYFTDFLVE